MIAFTQNIKICEGCLRKGERTKLSIIESAIMLFSNNGYDSTSIQAIADEIGLSQAAVFQHFKNKKQLLSAIREHITESVTTSVLKRLKPEMSARESLLEYLTGNLEWALKNRGMAQVIFLNYYMACFDEDFHQHLKHVVDLAESRVVKLTLACQREGDLPKDKDAQLVAQQVHDFLMGLSLKSLAATKTKTLTKPLRLRCEDFLNQILM